MKQHLEDDDLILHFYGETGSAAEPHLAECRDCRTRYQSLQRVMNSLEEMSPVPFRGEAYESGVWSQIEGKLGRKHWWTIWLAPQRWIPAMAALALLVAVFYAGRYTQTPEVRTVAVDNTQVRERVLLVAVGDHLERSEMMLVEIANANPESVVNLNVGRDTARDLVSANRLYRQTAMTSGDPRVITLLDELERVLVEIAHSPEELRGARLQQLRERIESEGLIFKIRVAGSRLAQEETL